MKLVIDIPDEKYEVIKSVSYYTFPKEMKEWGLEVIRNGTPLPKNHGRLIDADKLKEVYETTEDAECCQWTLYGVTSEIDDAPTIIKADKAESEEKDEDNTSTG